MLQISTIDRPVDGAGEGSIERTLIAGNEAIAVVLFLPPSLDALLVWPVVARATLREALTEFAMTILRGRESPFSGARIEYWIGDEYTRSMVQESRGTVRQVVADVESKSRNVRESLELFRLTYDDLWVEFTFNEESAYVTRAAVSSRQFDTDALREFFVRLRPARMAYSVDRELGLSLGDALRPPTLSA